MIVKYVLAILCLATIDYACSKSRDDVKGITPGGRCSSYRQKWGNMSDPELSTELTLRPQNDHHSSLKLIVASSNPANHEIQSQTKVILRAKWTIGMSGAPEERMGRIGITTTESIETATVKSQTVEGRAPQRAREGGHTHRPISQRRDVTDTEMSHPAAATPTTTASTNPPPPPSLSQHGNSPNAIFPPLNHFSRTFCSFRSRRICMRWMTGR